jgi:hypothetical protein
MGLGLSPRGSTTGAIIIVGRVSSKFKYIEFFGFESDRVVQMYTYKPEEVHAPKCVARTSRLHFKIYFLLYLLIKIFNH